MEEFERSKYVFSEMPAMVDISERAIKSREKQISLMLKELFLYKVIIKDLIGHKPNKIDKNLILNIAYYVLRNTEIFDKFQKKRQLPFNRITDKAQISKAYLEKWEDYIVAYIIILSNPNYKSIQDYLRIEFREEHNERSLSLVNTDALFKGIVIKENKSSSIILTSKGEFIKVKKSQDTRVGKEVEGLEKKGFKHIKIKLALVLVLLIIIAFAGYRQYTKSVRTIIIESSSEIKIQTNMFDNVVYAYSDTEKGKDLINYISPIDKNIDEVIEKSIEYAYDNKMISNEGLLITVTEEPIKYGTLKLTGEYIVEKNIKVLINNARKQHKLYESTIKQEEEVNEESGE
jgi:hypothetical protein